MAVVFGCLAVSYLVTVEGAAGGVLAAGALVSGGVLLAVHRFGRRPGLTWTGIRPVAWVFVGLVMANTLVHLAVTGSVADTAIVMVLMVAVGATLPWTVDAGVLVGATVAGWAVVAAVWLDGDYPLGARDIALAAALAALLHLLRGRSERHLRDSETRFRSLFTGSPVGMGLADEHGRFVMVNDALCRLFGRPASEVLGGSSEPYTHPDDQSAHAAARLLIRDADDGVATIEKRYVRPDGEVRWARLSFAHVDGPLGQEWTLAHFLDITGRKATELGLRDSQRNLATLAAVTRKVQAGGETRGTVLVAARQLAAATSALIVEPIGEDLVVTAATDVAMIGARVPRGEGSARGEAFATGRAVFAPDEDTPGTVPLPGARAMFWQPVHDGGRVVAALAVLWSEPLAVLPEQVRQAVQLLADETAVALQQEALRLELETLARTDPLTALANRRAWDDRLVDLMRSARRSHEPLVVAVIDLDHFKAYNDRLGHRAGDAHLRRFAAEAQRCLREVDVIARWGGEEFAIALPGCPSPLAETVLDRVHESVPHDQTCSIGWATWDEVESADGLLGRADRALYTAKAHGRDRVAPSA